MSSTATSSTGRQRGESGRVPSPETHFVTPTWQPVELHHGELDTDERDLLPDSAFAFPRQRKQPLTDASHVRNAVARFNQVKGVTEAERELAWANIREAANYFGVEVSESDWSELNPPRVRRRSWMD